MRRYVLVRHASAAPGGADPGLSAGGRAEAGALARRLEAWSFDAAWSSDLARAVETAGILLSGRPAPGLRRSPALREVEIPPGVPSPADDPSRYAAWETEAVQQLAERLAAWLTEDEGTKQDIQDVQDRVRGERSARPAGTDLRANPSTSLLSRPSCTSCTSCFVPSFPPSPPSTILVVSHAGPLRVLICLLLGLPPTAHWAFRVDRGSLTVVDRGDDMGTLTLLNDRCHLHE